MSQVVVVVTDAGDPAQFLTCLTRVCGTVPAEAGVVGVSARFPHLPTHLGVRVEQVRVRHADDVQPALDDLVTGEVPGSLVVAVTARAVLRSGWFESATSQASHVPHQIGYYGVGTPRLVRLLPGGVAPSRLTSYPLGHVAGVTEEQPRTVVPGPRREAAGLAPVRAAR
jgi:hypothetical protein